MKSHYKRLSCRTIKINGVRLDLEVYKTPDGMTFAQDYTGFNIKERL